MAIIGTAFPRFVPSTWYGDPSVARIHTGASTNATLVKASAGSVVAITISNAAASARYFRMYDLATAPVVGTSTVLFTLAIEQSIAPVTVTIPSGIPFANGIAWSLTGGNGDGDTTATSANDCEGFLIYS